MGDLLMSDRNIKQQDRFALRLLRMAPLERRAGGWRFGAARIGDMVVDRLIAQGRAISDGAMVRLATLEAAE